MCHAAGPATAAAAPDQAAAAAEAAAQQAVAAQAAEQPASSTPAAATDEEEDEDDENQTCGFCRFMKGGGCRQAFVVSFATVRSGCAGHCTERIALLNNTALFAWPLPGHLSSLLPQCMAVAACCRRGASAWTGSGMRAATSQRSAAKRCGSQPDVVNHLCHFPTVQLCGALDQTLRLSHPTPAMNIPPPRTVRLADAGAARVHAEA